MTSNTKGSTIFANILQSFLGKYPRDVSKIEKKIDKLQKKARGVDKPDVSTLLDLLFLNYSGFVAEGVTVLDMIYRTYTVAASAIDENGKLQEVIENPLTSETERAKLLERQSENTEYVAQAVDQIGDLLKRLYTEWLGNAVIPPAVTVEDVRKVNEGMELRDNG